MLIPISLFAAINEECLEENTSELICGFVWSSLISAGLTLLLLFNSIFTKKIIVTKKSHKDYLGDSYVTPH